MALEGKSGDHQSYLLNNLVSIIIHLEDVEIFHWIIETTDLLVVLDKKNQEITSQDL